MNFVWTILKYFQLDTFWKFQVGVKTKIIDNLWDISLG